MNKIADKLKWSARNCLPSVSGLLYLYGILSFLFDLEYAHSTFMRSHFPNPVMSLLLIGFSGFGLVLAFTFLFEKQLKREAFVIALVYSMLLLALSFYLTAAPGMSTCHCISFKDSMWSVKDWSRVEFALVVFVLSVIVFKLNHPCADKQPF